MSKLSVDAWRVVGRHLDLPTTLELLFPPLAERLPISVLAVRRVDLARATLEPAVGRAGYGEVSLGGVRALSALEFDELLGFCRSAALRITSAEDRSPLALALLPEGTRGFVLAGPLRGGAVPAGVALFFARPGEAFGASDVEAARELTEPLAVALENDQRLSELRRLRGLAASPEPAVRAPRLAEVQEGPGVHRGGSLDQALARHIEEALRVTLGRIEGPFGAAARLGVNPHTLRARMRRLGIAWQRFRPSGSRA